MPADLNDESILQSADALAEASARANRAQAEFKSRESLTSPGASLKPSTNLEDAEGAGLDSALAEVLAEGPKAGDAPTPLAGEVKTGVQSVPDKEEPAAKEEAAPEKTPEDEGGTSLDDLLKAATSSEAPAKEEKPADEDPYSAHKLPANASAKSREHFEKLKTEAASREKAAAERAAAAERKSAELEARLVEMEKSTGKLPEEVEQELKSLREHRALFDTENDPAFRQKFDRRITNNYEGIYTELKKHGLPEDEIAKLRKFGRAEKDAAIDGFLEKLDASSRRPIEARLVSNISIEEERQAELQETRGKATELLKSQQEAPAALQKQRVDTIANLVAPQIKQLGWLYAQDIPANTPPELRKQMEANNEFALKLQGDLRSAIVNDDPETRATAALSVPLAQFFAKENRALKTQVTELTAKLERFTKSASTSRLGERASVKSDAPPKAPNLSEDASDSIDTLFKEAGGKL